MDKCWQYVVQISCGLCSVCKQQNVTDQRDSNTTGNTLHNRWYTLETQSADLKPETKWRNTQRELWIWNPSRFPKQTRPFLCSSKSPRRSCPNLHRGDQRERARERARHTESERKRERESVGDADLLSTPPPPPSPSSSSILQSKGMKNNDSIQLLGFKVDRNRKVLQSGCLEMEGWWGGVFAAGVEVAGFHQTQMISCRTGFDAGVVECAGWVFVVKSHTQRTDASSEVLHCNVVTGSSLELQLTVVFTN